MIKGARSQVISERAKENHWRQVGQSGKIREIRDSDPVLNTSEENQKIILNGTKRLIHSSKK